MSLYQLLLIVKFLGVMGYAGGIVAAFATSGEAEGKRALHGIASPALLVTWMAGYSLLAISGLPMFELWPVGGLVFSLASNAALVVFITKGQRTKAAFAWVVVPLVVVVGLMVVKPEWRVFSR